MAVHILSLIAVNSNELTGDFIAGSVNTNPVVIRRIMGMLKKAGLVEVRPGVGGAFLLKAPEEITLLDVYRAVNVIEDNLLFRVHEESNEHCLVGRNIELVLQSELNQVQSAMEHRLAQTTLSQLTARFK
jgi:DNA-binding IscR family transcriptional regulator